MLFSYLAKKHIEFNMKNKKFASKVVKRLILCVVSVVLIIALPFVNIKSDENLDLIYRSFVGNKSDYSGFIEVWNIDTFESGLSSKVGFLNKVAEAYQKNNKGTYVIVRNVSEAECKNMLAQGQKPDVFSCSYGVASELAGYISSYTLEINDIYSNMLNAGKIDGVQYAIPWCYGNYYLISTSGRIEKYVEENKEIKLSDLALETGYEKTNKNSSEIIYSLGFGCNKYLLPQKAFSSYTSRGINSDLQTAIDKEAVTMNTPYSAYCNFVAGNCNILLGTQRDVYRIKNREKLGKISDVLYERVEGFTDLIQFALIADNGGLKYKHAQLFVEFLVSKKVQEDLLDTGLFSVNSSVQMTDETGAMRNIIPENINNYTYFNAFIVKSEIQNLQVIS